MCQSLLWAMREEPGGRDGRDEVLGLPWIHPLVADPGLERFPGKGNGNPLQYSCLENSMHRGAWQATVMGKHGRNNPSNVMKCAVCWVATFSPGQSLPGLV